MKRLLLIILLPIVLLPGCERNLSPETPGTKGAVYHGMIELGKRLEDPYAVQNISKALAVLYPTRAERIDITPTDTYLRILPSGREEYDHLVEMGLRLFDHPLDYQILREGDYYQDPAVGDGRITWQYTVVPHGFSLPEGLRYEILDQCYISENDPGTRADGIDWEAVERESFRLTGNEAMLVPATRAEPVRPSGRITIVDKDAYGGKPVGVSGVTVSCNTFVKFSSTTTDRDGYYEMPAAFSTQPRYRLIFKNEKGFAIGINLILVPASVSTLGKNGPEGVDLAVTEHSDGALFRRCAVNNAAYEYLDRCSEEDMAIRVPPKDLRLWIFPHIAASSAPMLHHGAILENELITKYLGDYAWIAKMFVPDITLGTKDAQSFCDYYLSVVHEMSHASHYAQVGNAYWDRFIGYVISSFIRSGGVVGYGTGEGEGAGCCEVGESWAYYNESKMFKERYGGVTPSFGTTYWFRPQILRYLDERGLGRSMIFKALTSEVDSRDKLWDRLASLYPEYENVIDQVFDRYEIL